MDDEVRLIKKKALTEQFKIYPDVEGALNAWMADVKTADWETPADIKDRYPHVSIIGDNRFVFNIRGNNYRLIVHVFFPARVVYVKFFGTHADYDDIDALTVDDFSDI